MNCQDRKLINGLALNLNEETTWLVNLNFSSLTPEDLVDLREELEKVENALFKLSRKVKNE